MEAGERREGRGERRRQRWREGGGEREEWGREEEGGNWREEVRWWEDGGERVEKRGMRRRR